MPLRGLRCVQKQSAGLALRGGTLLCRWYYRLKVCWIVAIHCAFSSDCGDLDSSVRALLDREWLPILTYGLRFTISALAEVKGTPQNQCWVPLSVVALNIRVGSWTKPFKRV